MLRYVQSYTILGLREDDAEDKLITTEVFGSAYLDGRSTDSMLTHAALVGPGTDWNHLRPICGKTKNIMDDESLWTKDKPTCPVCARKWETLRRDRPELLRWKE